MALVVDSRWSGYGAWGACSVTSGIGIQTRTRHCIRGDACGRSLCSGPSQETRSCGRAVVVVNGNWGSWSGYGPCSKTCDCGVMKRSRVCNNPAPSGGGASCVGEATQAEPCNKGKPCPINGGWSMWSTFTGCSRTCGGGIHIRTRTCTNPIPEYGGASCAGPAQESESCGTAQCGYTTVSNGYGGGNGYGRQCADSNPNDCGRWAAAGFCSDPTYVHYMRENCCISCQGRNPGRIGDFRNRYYSSKNYPEMMNAELEKRKKKK